MGNNRRVNLPLLEDDLESEGLLQPAQVVPDVKLPECAVLCFFGDVVAETVAVRPDARRRAVLTNEVGSTSVWDIEAPATE